MKTSLKFSKVHIEALLLSIVLFFQNSPRLVFSSLNMDEILTWHWASGSWGDLLHGVYNDTQQILFYALVKTFLVISPIENDLWIRIPSLLLGSCALGGIYCLIRKNCSLPTALFFIACSIMHPLVAYVATYNRPYALLFFLVAWHLVLSHRLLIQPKMVNNGMKWGLVVVTAAIPFAHYLGLFYLISVLSAVLLTVGMKPIFDILNSSAKKVFAVVIFMIISASLAYQFQFRERISWVFDGDFSFSEAASASFGLGGIFLLGFFVDLKNFKQRSLTEKFLCTGLVVGLSLMIVSRMWCPIYMIFLTPYSMWLTALYFEKMVAIMRKNNVFKDYALSLAMVTLVLINPYFIQRITPDLKVLVATNAFFKIFRTGNLDGIKNLLEHLKEQELIQADTRVLCIRPEWLLVNKPIELYSRMYFGRDICTSYVTNLDHEIDTKKYDYVIYVQLKFVETAKQTFQVRSDSNSHLKSILRSDDYELFKID